MARTLQAAWYTKSWMNYGRAPWLDATTFNLRVVRTYADCRDYFPGIVHLEWLSSYEWYHCCLIVTHSLNSPNLPQTRDLRNAPRFRSALSARPWLLGHNLVLLSHDVAPSCPSSFNLWTYWTVAVAAVGDKLPRRSSCVEAWHGIVDVYPDAVI